MEQVYPTSSFMRIQQHNHSFSTRCASLSPSKVHRWQQHELPPDGPVVCVRYGADMCRPCWCTKNGRLYCWACRSSGCLGLQLMLPAALRATHMAPSCPRSSTGLLRCTTLLHAFLLGKVPPCIVCSKLGTSGPAMETGTSLWDCSYGPSQRECVAAC